MDLDDYQDYETMTENNPLALLPSGTFTHAATGTHLPPQVTTPLTTEFEDFSKQVISYYTSKKRKVADDDQSDLVDVVHKMVDNQQKKQRTEDAHTGAASSSCGPVLQEDMEVEEVDWTSKDQEFQ